jgi:hypothetical protein
MVNKNTAARKIQRAFRRRHPYNNSVSMNFIKGPWAVKWYTEPNHRKFSLFSPEVFAELGNTHPLSRRIKRPQNIKLILIPGRKRTSPPHINKIPKKRKHSYSNSNSNSNNNVALSNSTIIGAMRGVLRNMQTPPRRQTLPAMVSQFTQNRNQIRRVINALNRNNNSNNNNNFSGGGMGANNFASIRRMGR